MLSNNQIIHNIERYKNVISTQRQEIADKELMIDSLTESLVREVKNLYIPYSDKMLHAAWTEQKKETKAERSTYEFIKKDIITRFFNGNKNAKLTEIVVEGYDSRKYNFHFTYHKIKFDIGIPNVKVVGKDNLSSVNYGKYSVHYESHPSCWNYIIYSYEDEEIAKAIAEFVEKHATK